MGTGNIPGRDSDHTGYDLVMAKNRKRSLAPTGGLALRLDVPWQGIVDVALRMAFGDRSEGGLETGEGLYAVGGRPCCSVTRLGGPLFLLSFHLSQRDGQVLERQLPLSLGQLFRPLAMLRMVQLGDQMFLASGDILEGRHIFQQRLNRRALRLLQLLQAITRPVPSH